MTRWLLAAAVAALCTGTAQAGEVPLYQPAPDWVAPAPPLTPAQLAPSAPMLILVDAQQRLKEGQVWRYLDTVTRIASPEMLSKSGTLTLPWQPDRGDLIVHRLEIVRGDQRIDLLAGGRRLTVIRREQQLEQRELNGELTATMPVEGLRVGDVLRTTISITNRDGALGGAVQASAMLPVAPTRMGYHRQRLLWPVGDDIRWKAYAAAARPVPGTVGGYRELVVEGTLPKPLDLPRDAPVRFQRPPMLEATSFTGWPAVSRAMAPLYAPAGLVAPGGPLAAEVARIKAADQAPLKRAALALALVQDEVRYLYNGMGGGNYTPQKPVDTWALRYGDCKAKTLLLLALLHELGIEAEPVVAPAEAGDLVAGRLPSAGAFDHVFVRAVVDGETLWMDGTGTGTKLADIRDVPPVRMVLPLRASGAEPMAVPFRAPARPDIAIAIDIDQRAGVTLPALVTIGAQIRGPSGAMLGLAAAQANDEQRRQIATEFVGKVMEDVRVTGQTLAFDPVTGIGTVTASGIVTTPWQVDRGRRRLVLDRALSELNFSTDRGRLAWRDLPVTIGQPMRAAYKVRVRLPDAGRGFVLSGDETLAETIAGRQVMRRSAIAGDLVTLEDQVASAAPEVAAGAVAATRARLALARGRRLEVVAPGGLPSRAREAVAARRGGLLKPLLAAHDQAILAEPDQAGPLLRRAEMLADVYDYRGAIPDVTRAIAIDPTADTYLWRARLHRLAGDERRQLADLDEAMKLEPENRGVVEAVAQYRLDHGGKDDALAMVQERIDAGGKEAVRFQVAKANLLARAGDGAAAIALLDEADKANPGDAGVLNVRCWIKGTMGLQLDGALRDCTKAIELSSDRADALDSRAMVYFRLGRMDEAMADLTAALEDAPDQAGSRYMRAVVLARQGKAADGREDADAARLMSPLIVEDYGRWGIRP